MLIYNYSWPMSNRLNILKKDLLAQKLNHEELFQKNLIDQNTFFFVDFLKDQEQEYYAKSLIANYFSVHIQDVMFVGSAKLGYSLNPKNLFRPFDGQYEQSRQNKDRSDLDVAIISRPLFEDLSERIYHYTDSFNRQWTENEYYPKERGLTFNVPICYKYFEYFSKGWFRPDMKPKGFELCNTSSYEDLKRDIYNKYRRKLGVAIYKDWFYFKYYHINNFKILTYRIKSETL